MGGSAEALEDDLDQLSDFEVGRRYFGDGRWSRVPGVRRHDRTGDPPTTTPIPDQPVAAGRVIAALMVLPVASRRSRL